MSKSKEDKILETVTVKFDGYKKSNRTKLSDIKRESIYNSIINRIGNNIFKWNGLPDEVLESCNSMMIELAVNCGVAAFYRVPIQGSVNYNKWVCTPIGFTGCLRNDGTSDHFITHGSDYALTDDQIKDYVIIKNDTYLSCEYEVTEWYASMLSETDLSQRRLVRWSRMTPIAKGGNGIECGKLEQTLKDVYEGAPWKVIDDNTKIMTGGSQTSRDDNVLRLTDDGAIERMHFLSEFHYELVRRICNLYNMPFHTTAKSAQNLESEVHNTDVFSQALSEDRLSERKRAAEKLTELLGKYYPDTTITVDYGETISKENEIIDSNVKEEQLEGEGTPPEDPTGEDDSSNDDN